MSECAQELSDISLNDRRAAARKSLRIVREGEEDSDKDEEEERCQGSSGLERGGSSWLLGISGQQRGRKMVEVLSEESFSSHESPGTAMRCV